MNRRREVRNDDRRDLAEAVPDPGHAMDGAVILVACADDPSICRQADDEVECEHQGRDQQEVAVHWDGLCDECEADEGE
jgi:hypothetical protein